MSNEKLNSFENGMGALWCSLMHDAPMWPIHGRYQCRTCGRQYPVPWAESKSAPSLPVRPARVSPWVLLPLLALAILARPARAGALIENTCPAAAVALARYTAGHEDSGRWSVETIQIDAVLPKLAKSGRLRAIRRLVPFGRPQYQVIETAGDSTVKQQVIVRYLSADEKSAEFAPSSVAVTPANYRFRYMGEVALRGSVAYAFRITPRKKRQGLVRGVLWLDGKTGIAVRETGYLVKSPSIFVKRVNLTRENFLDDGAVTARTTYLSIDTRLVGRAELVIEERPSYQTAQ
jgi:hypothetical protein